MISPTARVLVFATLISTPLTAQSAQGGELVGRIVDGVSGAALGYARVTLVIRPAGVLPSTPDGPARLAAGRTVQTLSDGVYRFSDLPAGQFRLSVRRIGYRPSSLELDLDGGQGLNLSVGLTVMPIRLEPLDHIAAPHDVSRITPSDSSTWDRVALERWRQANFLETDARVLAGEDLTETATLGHMDVLRALQRLPGVSSRDDWTAQPWIRGATSGHTRLYFDGLPIFNPVHAGGMVTSIHPDPLGGVFLYAGARPPNFSDGSAAVIDLRSRSARPDSTWSGSLSLTNTSVGASTEKRWNEGRVGVIAAVRRSWLSDTRSPVGEIHGISPEIPNDFADGVIRFDWLLRPDVVLETSGTWQRDWIDGFLTGGTANNRSSWGTVAGRSTIQFPLGKGIARQTLGFSVFSSWIRQIEPRTPLAAFDEFPTQEPTDNSVRYFTANGTWTLPGHDGVGPNWRFGYDVSVHLLNYRGAPPSPYSTLTYLYTADFADDVTGTSLWGEKRWDPSDDLTIRLGVRATINNGRQDSRGNPPTVRRINGQLAVSPHYSLRYRMNSDVSFTAAHSTHHQWVQPAAQSGVSFGPDFHVSPVWVSSADGTVLTTEIRTVGMESWLAPEWLGTVTFYDRKTTGLFMPDPRPGTTDDDAFLVTGGNDAAGLELQVQRLAGRWTGSVAYALGMSEDWAVGRHFPAPGDRRHILNATGSVLLPPFIAGGAVRLGGAANIMSGAPYTRIHPGSYDCRNYQPGGHCQAIVPTTVENPNAERAPWATGLNVMLDWSRSFNGWRASTVLEVQNVFNTPRSVTYAVDETTCRRRSLTAGFCSRNEDTFIPGLRRHYEVGVRITF